MANARPWVAWAERQIARVIIDEGLRLGRAGVVQGPLTVSFRCRLLRPNRADLRKVLGLGPALAQALQVEGVRIDDTSVGIVIEVPVPDQLVRTPSGPDLARHTGRTVVALGLDQWRKPAVVDLRQNPAVAFVGPTRRGKTSAMKSALYALTSTTTPGRLSYLILSEKRKDWSAFDGLAGNLGTVSDPKEAAVALAWVSDLLSDRAAGRLSPLPAVLVICDDLISLLGKRPDLADHLATLASMGGGENIFLWLGTQDAGSKASTGGMSVESNITARVVYKPTTATTAARAAGFGQLDLDQLSGHKGDALLIVDGRVRRVATGHVDDVLVAQLPTGSAGCRPWLQITTDNRPTTAGNQLQPQKTAPSASPAMPTDGDDGGTSPQPVATVVPVVAWPIPKRPPEGDEVDAIVRMKGDGDSLNAITRTVYGFKDGQTFGWIKEALEKGRTQNTVVNLRETGQRGNGRPDVLDLETEDGRAVLADMVASGLLSWPDPESLYTES